MAFEINELRATFDASTGLLQYQLVDLSTGNLLISPTTSGRVIGVLTSSGSTGSTRDSVQTVQFGGIAKVLAGATALDYGSGLTADTDGRAIAGTTNIQFGVCLSEVTSTSTAAEIISVLLMPRAGGVS